MNYTHIHPPSLSLISPVWNAISGKNLDGYLFDDNSYQKSVNDCWKVALIAVTPSLP